MFTLEHIHPRARVLPIAIMLLVALLSRAHPTTAHNVSPSHYSANCNTGTENVNTHAFLDRPSAGGSGSYKGAFSQVNFNSQLASCTSSSSFFSGGWSNIVGATGQGSGANNLIQMGIARQACHYGNSANCQSDFLDESTDFWYTPNNDGVIAVMPVDWANDGRTAIDKPQVGDTYQFTVQFYTVWPNVPKFQYCVDDVTTGDFDCVYTDRGSQPYWSQVWWGYEIWNDASRLGYQAGSGAISFPLMQYLNYNGSIWTTLTNDPQRPTCDWFDSNGYSTPLGYNCTVGGGSGQTTVYAYTSLHP